MDSSTYPFNIDLFRSQIRDVFDYRTGDVLEYFEYKEDFKNEYPLVYQFINAHLISEDNYSFFQKLIRNIENIRADSRYSMRASEYSLGKHPLVIETGVVNKHFIKDLEEYEVNLVNNLSIK